MDIQASQELCDVKETLGDWDGEDIKATQLMNIPTQKFI